MILHVFIRNAWKRWADKDSFFGDGHRRTLYPVIGVGVLRVQPRTRADECVKGKSVPGIRRSV